MMLGCCTSLTIDPSYSTSHRVVACEEARSIDCAVPLVDYQDFLISSEYSCLSCRELFLLFPDQVLVKIAQYFSENPGNGLVRLFHVCLDWRIRIIECSAWVNGQIFRRSKMEEMENWNFEWCKVPLSVPYGRISSRSHPRNDFIIPSADPSKSIYHNGEIRNHVENDVPWRRASLKAIQVFLSLLRRKYYGKDRECCPSCATIWSCKSSIPVLVGLIAPLLVFFTFTLLLGKLAGARIAWWVVLCPVCASSIFWYVMCVLLSLFLDFFFSL